MKMILNVQIYRFWWSILETGLASAFVLAKLYDKKVPSSGFSSPFIASKFPTIATQKYVYVCVWMYDIIYIICIFLYVSACVNVWNFELLEGSFRGILIQANNGDSLDSAVFRPHRLLLLLLHRTLSYYPHRHTSILCL